MKPPLGRKVTTAEADHCRTLKAIGSAEDSCCALNRLQWVRNGLTLTTADDYNSKVLSERGGAGQRVGYTKTGLRASPNRITQNHALNVTIRSYSNMNIYRLQCYCICLTPSPVIA